MEFCDASYSTGRAYIKSVVLVTVMFEMVVLAVGLQKNDKGFCLTNGANVQIGLKIA